MKVIHVRPLSKKVRKKARRGIIAIQQKAYYALLNRIETRTSNKRYKHEWTVNDHRRFLAAVTSPDVKANIQITHYPCELYDKALKGWRKVPFTSVTRGGEQREDIKRRVNRNIEKLTGTEVNERLRIMSEVFNNLTEYEQKTLVEIGINNGYGQEVI